MIKTVQEFCSYNIIDGNKVVPLHYSGNELYVNESLLTENMISELKEFAEVNKKTVNSLPDYLQLLESLDKTWKLTEVSVPAHQLEANKKFGITDEKRFETEHGHLVVQYKRDGHHEIHHMGPEDNFGDRLSNGIPQNKEINSKFVATMYSKAKELLDDGHSVRITEPNDGKQHYKRLALALATKHGYTVSKNKPLNVDHPEAKKYHQFTITKRQQMPYSAIHNSAVHLKEFRELDEREKATQKTITYVDAGGVQHTRKVPMKKHNQMTPEVIESAEKPGTVLHTVDGDGAKYSVKKGNNDYQVHRVTGDTTTHHIESYDSKDKAISVANSLSKMKYESAEVRVVGGRTYISAEKLLKHAKLIATQEGGNLKRGKITVTPEHKRMARVALEKEANEAVGIDEDREDRAMRNDFNSHSALASTPQVTKKFRLKNKKTGITAGIFNTHAEALSAHKDHPQRSMLTVENIDMQEVLKNAIDARKNLDENQEAQDVMSFKLHNFVSKIYENALDEMIQENTQPGIGSRIASVIKSTAKKVADKVAPGDDELLSRLEKDSGGKRPIKESSPFDILSKDKSKFKSQIQWNDNDTVPGHDNAGVHKGTYGSDSHKAPSGETKEKKAVGRPAGLYTGKHGDGKYNVSRDTDKKLAVGKNVHAGRAANMQKETEQAGLKWNDILASHKAIKGKGDAPVTYGSLFAAVAHHLGKK